MKVLALDVQGVGLDFCLRCQAAGHEVRWHIKPRKGVTPKTGDGMVDKVANWKPSARWADLIFLTDNTDFLAELEPFRDKVFGATEKAAKLELDRDEGMKFFNLCGIETAPYDEFTDYDKAISYVKKTGGRYVCKPSGKVENKALSYCSKSPADMCFMLEHWKRTQKKKPQFILQKFVKGVEIAVGAWIGPNGFLPYWCENFEHKKLMAGNLGPNCGEAGTVLRYSEESKLADEVLKPCESALVSMGMTGYVDVNTIVDEKGRILPLEWTVRPGWPTTYIQTPLHKGDPAEWMLSLVRGDAKFQCSEEIATGVQMSIPDYPYDQFEPEEVEGYPVYGLDEVDEASVHLMDIMQGRAPTMDGESVVTREMPVSCGTYILVATGTGKTVVESSRRAYDTLEQIEMPNSPFWRVDIGQRLKEDLPALQQFGFCEGWEYE